MMQILNKKRKLLGNKGFSLVELIIVIAIMAVLVAILVPQYLQYVEKSKVSADDSTADTLSNAVKVAAADSNVTLTASTTYTLVWAKAGGLTFPTANANLQSAIEAAINSTLAAYSKPMGAAIHKTAFVVTVAVDASGIPTITDNKTTWDQGT